MLCELMSHKTLLFFFKQKTAYEITVRLEFRRVLFRSAARLVRDDVLAARDGDDAHRLGCDSVHRRDGVRRARAGAVGARRGGRGRWRAPLARLPRSEERRVGKEWRSWGSPSGERENGG